MILSFKFNSLLGSAYKSGNICFSPNKNIVFSPVGNKVSVIDLEKFFIILLAINKALWISREEVILII